MPGTKPDGTKPDDLSQLNFAVFATQGGGLARESNGTFVWYEVPEKSPEFRVGDPIPAQWGTAPANSAAHEEMLDGEFPYVP